MKICRVALILALVSGAPLAAQEPQTAAVEPSNPAQEYLIGIEDVLRVVVWNEEGLSLSVAVRPDGYITIPLVNDVHVAGRSPREVAETLKEDLSKFIRDPNVTVIVEEINSYRVFVLGEVNLQGVLVFKRPTRLLQAISSAGGLTEFSKREVLLLREQHGVEKRIRVNLKPLLAGSPEVENIVLMPNDTVIVN